MTAITSAKASKNLAATIIKVCDDREAVVIEHDDEHTVVMLPLEEYESMSETAYLMRSPANARYLQESIEQLRAGKGVVREIDLDA
ncbi:MAG TPA: type II toxin-antitoxin system Phd/YefM family antitoxin [Prosthecobacter sp.]|jgi:antitoxin YefM|nr:type II toxin-antitoxin system Phd/YefM family antitoxin [Prosthecobacter sp.]